MRVLVTGDANYNIGNERLAELLRHVDREGRG